MIRAVQLFTFLSYCEDSPLEKVVLDCGAGFPAHLEPLLQRFVERGYQSHGIEIQPGRVEVAEQYEREHGIRLNIRQGDMRALPYPNDSMSFVFSYNTIFHMTKADMRTAVHEIERVMRPEGLCFVNFLSVDDSNCGQGEAVGPGEFRQLEDVGDTVIHTFLSDDEANAFFAQSQIIYKEKRIREWLQDGQVRRSGMIDYIVQKH
jgi:ubiquinone/menaquinone biosynthesis C-methylase UbiE